MTTLVEEHEVECIEGFFSDETNISRFYSNGHAWCWVRDGESQLQTHLMS